jgi:hypothetical protein
MKIIRYIVGVIGFLLVWFVIAVVVGFIMVLLFPRPGEHIAFVGIGLDWRNLPGEILGFFGGIGSFRASIKSNRS